MWIDPAETTPPERFGGLRTWLSIDTAERHQPVWLVVNPVVGALVDRGRAASMGGNGAVSTAFAA